MATIFLSHASKDDNLARQLESWLKGQGFDDLFVDHSDIRGGDKWTEALRRAKGAARVVLCLVTPRWLASDECFGEFISAWYSGQRIVPLLAGTTTLDAVQTKHLRRVLADDQGFDLSAALIEGRLELDAKPEIAEPLKAGLRAAGALAKIGLDPEAFEVDPEFRPTPYPGLQSFGDTDADAAVFYGRSPEIASCLEDLREMRANGVRKPYAILGASGSGKSSLLKAGVLPRLRRERGWLVLRTFRPGAEPLFNFAEGIAQSLADHGDKSAPGTIRDRLRTTWDQAEKHEGFATGVGLSSLRETLETEIFAPLRERTDRPGATALLPLDQAEELTRAEGEGADALCDYLRAALLPPTSTDGADVPAAGAMIALTTRSDSFPELQAARRFAGLDARCADIRPVPLHRFDDAIEKPAARYGVQIAPDLVDGMIEDAPVADALPLFAFAMENLWRQFHEAKRIGKADYNSIGRLDGLIDRAAERALRGIPPGEERSVEKQVSEQRDRLAAKTFVPLLAQLSEKGEPMRRVASLDRFDDQAREMLEPFDRWRLVVMKPAEDGHGSTVEVAHEAIFRGWDRFQRWLEPAKARLEALRGLESAASIWDRQGHVRAYLDHRGRRLRVAMALIEDAEFKEQVGPTERAYLAAASRTRRHRRTTVGAAALAAMTVVGAVAWMFENDVSPRQVWANTMTYIVSDPVPRARAELKALAVKAGLVIVEPEMVTLEGGTFLMGSPQSEAGYTGDEGPQHEVSLTAFAIGKYEVTFEEWDLCVADGGCEGYWPSDRGWGHGKRPVIGVSWENAQAYVKWLSEATGDPYRLPSEAEWEYAARAETTTRYYWGDDDPTPEQANSGQNVGKTTEVGSYPPNPWGIHDMHGNVWEWVQDCKNDSYEGAPRDGSAWTDGDCRGRVSRGGSWGLTPEDLRSAERRRNFTDFRGVGNLGFRIARTLR